MANFPLLSTGAVTQYPTGLTTGQAVEVIHFLDGSDQRYLTHPKTLRQWEIRLDLLNETEVAQLEAFFVEQQGEYSTFVFSDPISGSMVPNCRIAAPGMASEYLAVDIGSASLIVVETNA